MRSVCAVPALQAYPSPTTGNMCAQTVPAVPILCGDTGTASSLAATTGARPPIGGNITVWLMQVSVCLCSSVKLSVVTPVCVCVNVVFQSGA